MTQVTPEIPDLEMNKKILGLGINLSRDNREIPELEKNEMRAVITSDKSFIAYCKDRKDWTHEEHNNLKNILELPQNQQGYYTDIFGRGVSYNGDRTLRREKTEFTLSEIHNNEIDAKDFDYFRRYYIMITTRNGIDRPEQREYQNELWSALETLEDVVCMFPRQASKCTDYDTEITIRNKNTGITEKMSIGQLYDLQK